MNVKSKILFSIIINITLVVIAFGTSIIISNILGPEGFGFYKYIILVATTLTLVANFGLLDMLVVKLSKKEINLKEYLASVFIAVMPLFIVVGSILFYFLFGRENINDKPLVHIALLYCLIHQLNTICQQSILALDKLIKFQVFEIVKQALFLCLAVLLYYFFVINIKNIFLVLLIPNSIAIVYVAYLSFVSLKKSQTEFGTTLRGTSSTPPNVVPNSVWLFRREGVAKQKLNLPFNKELTKNSLMFYLFNIMNFFTSRIDIYILKWSFVNNFYMIGIYSLAITLVEKIWIVPEAIRSVLFLELSNNRRGEDFVATLLRLLTFFIIISGIIIAFFSIWVIPLVFPKFYESVLPFLVLLPGALFYCYNKTLGVYFTVREMLKINTYTSIIVLSINIAINLILIPRYDILGASIAKSVAFIAGAVYHISRFQKVSGISVFNLLVVKKEDFYLIPSLRGRSL